MSSMPRFGSHLWNITMCICQEFWKKIQNRKGFCSQACLGKRNKWLPQRLGSHSLASLLFLYLAHSHTSHRDLHKLGLYLSELMWFVEIQKHLYLTGEGSWDSVSRYGDFRHNYLCQMQYDQEFPVTSFMATQLWPWIWILLFLEADGDSFLFYLKKI